MSNDACNENEIWQRRFYELSDFARAFSWFDDQAEFYNALAENLQKITKADSVNIRLLTPTRDMFKLYAFHGDAGPEILEEFNSVSAHQGRFPSLIEKGEPIVFDFAQPTSEDVKWERGVNDGYSSAVILALPGSKGILGAADLLYHERRSWSEDDIAWMREVGNLAGTIIGNTLLFESMISLRIADERNRLSTEIHDNLAQAATVISLESNSALDSLKGKDMEMLERNLDLIKRASNELEPLIRGELANLRTQPGSSSLSSMRDMEEFIESFCRQWGISYEFERDKAVADTALSERVAVQLIRVINEALVNIVRHAEATSVRIAYEVVNDALSLVIEDDGCGFELDNVPSSHLGLRIMQERLETIGASVVVSSKVGEGTRVAVEVPYLV